MKRKDLVEIIDIEKTKAVPVGFPKVISTTIETRSAKVLTGLFQKKINAQRPESANAYVLGDMNRTVISHGDRFDPIVLNYQCAVQYYRIPDEYLPKPGNKSK